MNDSFEYLNKTLATMQSHVWRHGQVTWSCLVNRTEKDNRIQVLGNVSISTDWYRYYVQEIHPWEFVQNCTLSHRLTEELLHRGWMGGRLTFLPPPQLPQISRTNGSIYKIQRAPHTNGKIYREKQCCCHWVHIWRHGLDQNKKRLTLGHVSFGHALRPHNIETKSINRLESCLGHL